MAQQLHQVTQSEVPVLLIWLGKYLPDSWTLYGIVRENHRLAWPGYTFYTVGWPEIEAAAMKDPQSECGCMEYFASTRKLALYSPDTTAAHRLITWPEFVDWSRPAEIRIPRHLSEMVEEVVKDRGNRTAEVHSFHLMMAQEGDVANRSTPDDLELRQLDSKLHAAVVNSTWKYRRAHSEPYIQQLLTYMPSLGLFDKNGVCVGHITGTDSGTFGILYVIPEIRGRTLASILLSRLAQTYFELGLPAVTYCHVDNQPAIRLHEKIGFKKSSILKFVYHSP